MGLLPNRWRRLLLAGSCTFAVLACVPAGAADVLAEAKTRGHLRVAMEGSYPPFSFLDPKTGQMTGYDADVARLLGMQLGLPVEIVTTEWADIFAHLAEGRYDVIVSQVSVTPARRQLFDFSTPYTYSRPQLILRSNERAVYTGLAALKGRTIGVARGTIYEAQAHAVPGIRVRSYPAAPETLQDLAFGRIDAALNDSLMVSYLVQNATLPIKAGPLVGAGVQAAVTFRKGDPALKAAVDGALGRLQADGSLSKVARKWFGVDVSRPGQPAARP
jgi:cystine transport system substrate-binding protein